MVNLGDHVRDFVSGFEGIAVACHSYLNGCERITVQPKVGEDGKLPDTGTFDEPQLAVITPRQVAVDNGVAGNGGPAPYIDKRRY